MAELHALSAGALAALIRDRAVSPVEVVDAHIARIQQVNPALNAVVAPRFDAARAAAQAAEARVVSGDPLPPLHGVPCTIKEFIGVRGMPQTAGIKLRSHVTAHADATAVRRLRAAGAIVLGVTNAPEGGLWHETSNPLYGRTSNPHDLYRTSGGSSGGEGAIIAAGGSPFGLGSDTGGSIRFPAAFCGIAGHKPTGGLVPNTGHYPHAPQGTDAPMVVGPLARHVADLRLVLDVIAGPDGIDPVCRRQPAHGAPRDWSEITVYPLPTNGRVRASKPIQAAVWKAATALQARGARVEEWAGPDLSRAFQWWAAMLQAGDETYDDVVGAGLKRTSPTWQALRWGAGRSDHSGAVLMLMWIERLLGRLGKARTQRLLAEGIALRTELSEALGPRGLILHPTFPRTAPRHRAIVLGSPYAAGCTTLFNVGENPVTVVRVDTDPLGLPIGIQIAGARGADGLTLAAAEALEAEFSVPEPVTPRWGQPLPLGLRLA